MNIEEEECLKNQGGFKRKFKLSYDINKTARNYQLKINLNFSVSANTAIYMCACAAVFLISIPVLREKITIIKVSGKLIELSTFKCTAM